MLHRRSFLQACGLVATLILICLVGGCGAEATFAPPPIYTVTIDTTETGALTATLPDGRVLDAKSYEIEGPSLFQAQRAVGNEVKIDIGDHLGAAIATDLPPPPENQSVDNGQVSSLQQGLKIQRFGFTLTDGTGYRKLYGCIDAWVNYYAVRLNFSSWQVFDFHFAKYLRPPYRCYGVYESVSYFSKCICLPNASPPSLEEIRKILNSGFVQVGVGVAAAASLAEAAAPYVLPMLIAL